jgi:hypothetical protein
MGMSSLYGISDEMDHELNHFSHYINAITFSLYTVVTISALVLTFYQ